MNQRELLIEYLARHALERRNFPVAWDHPVLDAELPNRKPADTYRASYLKEAEAALEDFLDFITANWKNLPERVSSFVLSMSKPFYINEAKEGQDKADEENVEYNDLARFEDNGGPPAKCKHGQLVPHRYNDNGYTYSECLGP